jgi:hypothetical protein
VRLNGDPVSLENQLGSELPAEPLGGRLLVVAFGMRRFRSDRVESLFDAIRPAQVRSEARG